MVLGSALLLVPAFFVWQATGARALSGLSAPAQQLPLDTSVRLEPGTYVVFQRTGSYQDGVVSVSANSPPTVEPSDVSVTGDDGTTLLVRGRTRGYQETLSRDGLIYTDAVAFEVIREQGYHVLVGGEQGEVLLAPSLGWQVAPLGYAALWGLPGVLLLVGGLVALGRRDRALRRTQPPPGWYLDPQVQGRWRYWNGLRYTDDVR